jgi:hypothetical protein
MGKKPEAKRGSGGRVSFQGPSEKSSIFADEVKSLGR